MPAKDRKDIYRRKGMINVALGEEQKEKLILLARKAGLSASGLAADYICQYEDISEAFEDSKDDVRYLLSWIDANSNRSSAIALMDLNAMRLQRSRDRGEWQEMISIEGKSNT